VIVNEFGDVGIDGDILKSCGATSCAAENIIELTNGCICCTVAGDFAPAISALLAREPRPEHILIETSGLALPKPLVKAFDWPDLRNVLTVDGVIAVVDASAVAEGRFADDPEAIARQRQADPSLDHDNPLEEVYEDQLLCADMVVLNKTDLLSADALARVRADIAQAIPRAVKIIETHEGRIDPDVLLGLKAAAEDDLAQRPSHHDSEEGHDHDDFDTFIVDLPAIDDADSFLARLADVAGEHEVLRMKGYLEIASKPMRLLVQGVGRRFRREFDRPWGQGETRRGRLVVIGEKGINQRAIAAALQG
jgi:cobalamin biosynthesis protein CobW